MPKGGTQRGQRQLPEPRVRIGFVGEGTQECKMGWSVQGAINSSLYLELKITGLGKEVEVAKPKFFRVSHDILWRFSVT